MKTKQTWGPKDPRQPYNPDAELVRSFRFGCGVIVVLFLCGWATIAFFWLR